MFVCTCVCVMQVQQHMLDALARSLSVPNAVQDVGPEMRQLAVIARQLTSASDTIVRTKSTEVHKALSSVV